MLDFYTSTRTSFILADELTTGDYFYIIPTIVIIVFVAIGELIKYIKKKKKENIESNQDINKEHIKDNEPPSTKD